MCPIGRGREGKEGGIDFFRSHSHCFRSEAKRVEFARSPDLVIDNDDRTNIITCNYPLCTHTHRVTTCTFMEAGGGGWIQQIGKGRQTLPAKLGKGRQIM